jgi:hypothetical protein
MIKRGKIFEPWMKIHGIPLVKNLKLIGGITFVW